MNASDEPGQYIVPGGSEFLRSKVLPPFPFPFIWPVVKGTKVSKKLRGIGDVSTGYWSLFSPCRRLMDMIGVDQIISVLVKTSHFCEFGSRVMITKPKRQLKMRDEYYVSPSLCLSYHSGLTDWTSRTLGFHM